jgi:hypothetical protein
VKIWVTKDNFTRIQEGSYPTKFETTVPSNLSEYVEMTVNATDLKEWVTQHITDEVKTPNKKFLFG